MADKPVKLEVVKGTAVDLLRRPGKRPKRVVLIPRGGDIDLVEFGTYYPMVLQKPVAIELDDSAVSYEPSPE